MSDLREAMEKIMSICNNSRQYNRRTQQIHDVAMRSLGMTQGQRTARHMAVFERTQDQFGKSAFETREAKRLAKLSEWQAEAVGSPVKQQEQPAASPTEAK